MNKELATKRIANNLSLMREMFDECVTLADEHQIGFELPWGGEGTLESGLGGYYSPEGDKAVWKRNEWKEEYPGWNPSAHTC